MPVEVTTITATQRDECHYEFTVPKDKARRVSRHNETITESTSPRWDDLMGPPWNGSPQGYLNVCRVTRASTGEILSTKPITGFMCHMNRARAFMREFEERAGRNDRRPWDQEDHHRRQAAEAKRQREEDRVADLERLAMLAKASAGAIGGDA